jgi:hypothetical protein
MAKEKGGCVLLGNDTPPFNWSIEHGLFNRMKVFKKNLHSHIILYYPRE